MESQLKHPHEDHHTSLESETHDQHTHGEKQSVLKKVKAKAKKIKETIKKHGHHHGHEQHEHHPEFHEEEEEEDDEGEDEYDEMEKDPEVHGDPIYESQVARNPNVGLGGNQGLLHHRSDLERTDEPAIRKDHTKFGVPTSHAPKFPEKSPMQDSEALEHTLKEQPHPGKDNANISHPTHAVYESQVTRNPSVGLEGNQGLMHQPADLERTDEPSAYNTKLGVPTSYESEGIKPEFGNVSDLSLKEDLGAQKNTLNDLPRPGNYETKVSDPTGAGGEETPGSSSLLHSLDKMTVAEGRHDQLGSGRSSRNRDVPDDSPLLTWEAVQQDIAPQGSGYSEKLAYVTAALADKTTVAKDAAAAKLGYGDKKGDVTDNQSDQTSYTDKASHAASLLADKACGVKDAVASKLGYGGVGKNKTPREPLDYDALMQQNQSGYMEKVSGVTSALAEKAVEAKNVVASKLGYDQAGEGVGSEKSTSQGHTGAPTIADKTAQLKNMVASKLGYTREGGSPRETSTWAEKLKPGDVDKALSELISESVYKKSPRRDAESNQQGEVKVMGKVTESEEVARRLGTSKKERSGDLSEIPGSESPRKVVVDKIKEAVSSLWSSGDQTHPQTIAKQTSDQHEVA